MEEPKMQPLPGIEHFFRAYKDLEGTHGHTRFRGSSRGGHAITRAMTRYRARLLDGDCPAGPGSPARPSHPGAAWWYSPALPYGRPAPFASVRRTWHDPPVSEPHCERQP